MKKFILIILVVLGASFLIIQSFMALSATIAFGENMPNSSAKSMVLIEKQSGRIICSKNEQEKLPMASTTKIFTTYFALTKCTEFDKIVSVDNSAVGVEGTSMYLKHNEEISYGDLLYGIIVPSGNDACVAVSCFISGSEEKFVEEMNEFYSEMGLINTHLVNSHGLDATEHYTCAYDLARVTALALDNEKFAEIVKTKSKIIEPTNAYGKRYLTNKNRLLKEMPNCIGVKIGFTDNAGRCLVSAVERDNDTFICVVLNCYDMFNESKNLLNYATRNYKNYSVVKPKILMGNAGVQNGTSNSVKYFNNKGFSYPLTEEEFNSLDINVELLDNIVAPVKLEQNLGLLKVKLNDKIIFSTEILSAETVSLKTLSGAKRIIHNWA